MLLTADGPRDLRKTSAPAGRVRVGDYVPVRVPGATWRREHVLARVEERRDLGAGTTSGRPMLLLVLVHNVRGVPHEHAHYADETVPVWRHARLLTSEIAAHAERGF